MPLPLQRRTKILATIGPASGTPERLAELVAAGMDGARLNFSHGTHEDHRRRDGEVAVSRALLGRDDHLLPGDQGSLRR